MNNKPIAVIQNPLTQYKLKEFHDGVLKNHEIASSKILTNLMQSLKNNIENNPADNEWTGQTKCEVNEGTSNNRQIKQYNVDIILKILKEKGFNVCKKSVNNFEGIQIQVKLEDLK